MTDEEHIEKASDINSLIEELYGINYVTCGQCGKICWHDVSHEWDMSCWHCWNVDDMCHFPDLFY